MSAAAASKGSKAIASSSAAAITLDLSAARVKAIARQDPDMSALSTEVVEFISVAADKLLGELVQGSLRVAEARQMGKAKGKGGEGAVTIRPEDICTFVASEERLACLRRVTEPASKQGGFLEGYRERSKAAAADASSRKRQRSSASAVVKAMAGLAEGAEDEDQGGAGEYEDEEIEGALIASKEGGGGGGGVGEGKGALALDEDYDDDDDDD